MIGDWDNHPKAGERWRSRTKPIETRTVHDRTLRGDVVYVVGRRTRFNPHVTCTHRNWLYWKQRTRARQINADS